jgi:hypothetical protein
MEMKVETKEKKRNIYWYLQIGVTIWMVYQVVQFLGLLYMVVFGKDGAKFTAGILGLKFPYSSDNFEIHMYFLTAPMFILQLLVLWYARGFLKNLASGAVFSMKNANYLRNTGIAFFIEAIFANILSYFAGKELFLFLKQEPGDIINGYVNHRLIFRDEGWMTTLPKGDVLFSYDFQSWPFMWAIAVIIISMLFRKAVQVAQENELTI